MFDYYGTRWKFQSTLPRRERHGLLGYLSGQTPISIHAPTKGATDTNEGFRQAVGISIHAPTKGATLARRWLTEWRSISIHAPTKGATFSVSNTLCVLEFQSTLPRRERPYIKEDRGIHGNFNPRSHEGSDIIIDGDTIKIGISIHAPTKGATDKRQQWNLYHGISIHAPTKGATWVDSDNINKYAFQSTLPRRERLVRRNLMDAINGISIHAPTKGATASVVLFPLYQYHFNPRSHEGSDAIHQCIFQYIL